MGHTCSHSGKAGSGDSPLVLSSSALWGCGNGCLWGPSALGRRSVSVVQLYSLLSAHRKGGLRIFHKEGTPPPPRHRGESSGSETGSNQPKITQLGSAVAQGLRRHKAEFMSALPHLWTWRSTENPPHKGSVPAIALGRPGGSVSAARHAPSLLLSPPRRALELAVATAWVRQCVGPWAL